MIDADTRSASARLGWSFDADGNAAPVLDGIVYADRALAPSSPRPEGLALELHALDMPLAAARFVDPMPPLGAPSPEELAALAAAVEGPVHRVLVVGSAGLVGEIVAASRPDVTVVTVLHRGAEMPPPAVIQDAWRDGQRSPNHEIVLADPERTLPRWSAPFDALVLATQRLPEAWNRGLGECLRPNACRIDGATVDGRARLLEPAGTLRVLSGPLGYDDLAHARAPAPTERELGPIDLEILFFGWRGYDLAAIARHGRRELDAVLAAADGLQRSGLVRLVASGPGAPRLHRFLATGRLLPAPADARPFVFWRRAVARFGERDAVVLEDGRALTYRELDVIVARYVELFRALGLPAGARIAVAAQPCLEVYALFWAAMCAGLGYLVLPPDTPAAAVVDVARRLELARIFVSAELPAANSAHEVPLDAFEPTSVWSPDIDDALAGTDGCTDGRSLAAVAAPAVEPAVIALTSGTTGASKAILISGRSAVRGGMARARSLAAGADERMMSTQGMTHENEIRACFTMPASVGAASIVAPAPTHGHVFRCWEQLEANRATRLVTSSAFAEQLHVHLVDGKLAPLASLRFIDSGGSHLSLTMRRDLVRRLGARYNYFYGMTEGTGTLVGEVLTSDRPDETPRRLEMDGVWQVRNDDGSLADAGETGSFWVLHDRMMDGYLTPEGLDRGPLVGAWLTGQDVVARSADGRLEVLGRRDDLFSTATGQLVVPRAVEEVLETHEAVRAAAVVPGIDEFGGAHVVAFVELVDGADLPNRLAERVRERLGPNFTPRRVCTVDALPRNRMGKLLRRELAGRPLASVDG